MLSDRHYQLLTAYVDGEIDDRDRQAVLRLVQESAEAKALLTKLQADARRVQQLPRVQLDAQFSKQISEALTHEAPIVRRLPTQAGGRRLHPIGLGMAAAVLLAVTVGSWFLYRSLKDRDPVAPGPVVKRTKEPVNENKVLDPQVAELVQSTFMKYAEKVPEIGKRLAVSDPVLTKELAGLQEPAVHLEVRCRDSAEVLKRLQKALNGGGVKLWVDANAQARLTRHEGTDYVVFAENLPPAEITKLLAQVANDQFDSVLFNPLQFEHRKELSALLGVSVFHIEPRRFDTVAVVRDPEEFGFGQNGKAVRPKPNVSQKLPTPEVERMALVVSSTVGESRRFASEETRRFLGSRRGNRPGTLQVVIVLHQSF